MGESTFSPGITPSASSLKPGCVLLFSGLTDLERRIQETLDSFWSRCALVVRGPRGTPVLLQATSRPISKNLIDGQLRTGVPIVSIDDVLEHFHGHVSIRALRPELAQATDAALAAFATAKHGIPFNMSPFYALRAAAKSEFAIVILGAFGYFSFLSVYSAFNPSPLPPISQQGLQGLIVFESIVLLLLVLFLHLRGWTWKCVGIAPSIKYTLIGFGLAGVIYLADVLVWIAVHDLGMHPSYAGSYAELAIHGLHIRSAVAVSIVNPLYEELFLCGYLVTALKEKYAEVTAVNISVGIRLVCHLYQGAIGVLSIIPFGLMVTWWYARTGKLWPILVAHAVIDLTSLLRFVN
jgi:uncharacterized protein